MKLSEAGQAVKAKLKTLESKKRLLSSIQRQIANAKADMSGLGAVSYDGVKVGNGDKSSVQERFVALISRLEKRYETIMEQAFAIEDAIAEAVQYLNELEQAIIIDRYVNGYSWRKIERLHNYCERQVYYIHNEALEDLARNEAVRRIFENL